MPPCLTHQASVYDRGFSPNQHWKKNRKALYQPPKERVGMRGGGGRGRGGWRGGRGGGRGGGHDRRHHPSRHRNDPDDADALADAFGKSSLDGCAKCTRKTVGRRAKSLPPPAIDRRYGWFNDLNDLNDTHHHANMHADAETSAGAKPAAPSSPTYKSRYQLIQERRRQHWLRKRRVVMASLGTGVATIMALVWWAKRRQ